MARIDKGALTKLEIVAEASKQFLEKGYSNTTIASISQALEMSKGNLTFYYQTKEYLLAELVDLLFTFQWEQMEKEVNDDISPIMAICLELTTIAGACEEDEAIRDLLVSAYTSPLCLAVIRKNDSERSKVLFKSYRPEWNDEYFEEAEILVSGVEYAILATTGTNVPPEIRISGALNVILGIYGIPNEIIKENIQRVFALDYRSIGKNVFADFKVHVEETNNQARRAILKVK